MARYRLFGVLMCSLGCGLLGKDEPPPAPAAEEPAAAPAPPVAPAAVAAPASPGKFGVPFAWERSPEEPLAKARRFLAEALQANTAFAGRGRERLASPEAPTATVLTCSDARVDESAWRASAGHTHTVRNLAHQVSTTLGSVEYGVERLHTPVLLIVGHTGCAAIGAALEGAAKMPGAIADELSQLVLAPAPRGSDPLTSAVIANVNTQVGAAVAHFGARIQSGELTVIGAVYDVEDQLGQGASRLHLVNVNGNVDAERVGAFRKAIETEAKAATSSRRRSRTRAVQPASPQATLGAGATVDAVHIIGNGHIDPVSAGTLKARRRGRGRAGGLSPELLPVGTASKRREPR